jgi:hypothetical protein
MEWLIRIISYLIMGLISWGILFYVFCIIKTIVDVFRGKPLDTDLPDVIKKSFED